MRDSETFKIKGISPCRRISCISNEASESSKSIGLNELNGK